ncbi:MAG: carbohydrate kinase family protein [Candidatus Paceibacterota bacterium]
MRYDFIALGDITTDSFIELSEKHASVIEENGKKKLEMNFGDKLPYEDVVVVPAVGNSPNASVSAHRLGLRSGLATNMGDDRFGEEDIKALKEEGVDITYTKIHKGKGTNHHYVLRYKEERTILVKHHQYDYKLPDFKEPPKWIYLSSFAENSLPHHHEITEYVRTHDVKLAFQPGTFQMELGYDALKDVYEASELFFCNKQEAQRILETKESDIRALLEEMRERGPNIPVITDGVKGAYAYDGNEKWHMPMYPDPKPPVDRTGAGDSFSSTFTSAIALGEDIPTALSWGPINSMSVVQYIGAQEGLLTREKLLKYLEDAPPDYVPEKIS